MCTAVTYHASDHYFGRNLDYEHDFGECVIITPRNMSLPFRCLPIMDKHYAMIGMAINPENYPLYFDAVNEHGLCVAALNFPYSAKYMSRCHGKNNVAPFEFIPWILGDCKTVIDARSKLKDVNLVDIAFNTAYPLSPLHWIISDADHSIVVEQTKRGLHIYDNPVGVLTNEPPFPFHMTNLHNYLNITADEPQNRFSDSLSLTTFSRGMGGLGLPGDLSSVSRFVRAAFTKLNCVTYDSESQNISQIFHILGSVIQQEGCVKVGDLFEKTIYSGCYNASKGIYYYNTYENSQLTAVSLHGVDLESKNLYSFPLVHDLQLRIEN